MKLFQKSLCSAMSHVVLFACPKKLNISQRTQLELKFYQISCVMIAMQPRKEWSRFRDRHINNIVKNIMARLHIFYPKYTWKQDENANHRTISLKLVDLNYLCVLNKQRIDVDYLD